MKHTRSKVYSGLYTWLMVVIAIGVLLSCIGPQGRQAAAQNERTKSSADEFGGIELPQWKSESEIVKHVGYTAAYNHTTLCPDWVAWVLTAEEVEGMCNGSYPFSRDPSVRFPKASREDYSSSGFDKGHMAPRADMKWSEQALMESYYFTNICPQDHSMNAGAWRKIEELTRSVAQRKGWVAVVCGPVYTEQERQHIGEACVHVPDMFFKALAAKDSEGWHTVAFLMTNDPQNSSPRQYAVSVDSVEALLSHLAPRGVEVNLFPSVPETAEQTVDWQWWGQNRAKHRQGKPREQKKR